jgi:hypothetical protein
VRCAGRGGHDGHEGARGDPVSDAADGGDQRSARAELLAQPSDVDIDGEHLTEDSRPLLYHMGRYIQPR